MFGFPVLMNDCTLPTGFRLKVSWNFEQWLIKRMIQYDSCDVWFHTITLQTVLPMQRNGFPGTSWKARESTVLGGPGPWRPQLSYHVFFNTPTFDQNESIFRPHWTTLTLLLSCPRANKCSIFAPIVCPWLFSFIESVIFITLSFPSWKLYVFDGYAAMQMTFMVTQVLHLCILYFLYVVWIPCNMYCM